MINRSEMERLPLKVATDGGKPPERRLKDAGDGQKMVSLLMDANRDRARFAGRVKGLVDGVAPFSPAKLRNSGQAYRCNVNFMEAKSAVSSALVPYYDLFTGARYHAEVRLDTAAEEARMWSRIVTEEFDTMLRAYSDFDFNVQAWMHDRVLYGKGFLMWRDIRDWHFGWVPQSRVLVADGIKSCLETLEFVVVRESYRVNDLWTAIRDKDAAKAFGWNVDEVVRAIRDAMPDWPTNEHQYDYDAMQQRVKDKDILEGTRASVVQAAHVYVREFDGTVTHCIVTESAMQQYSTREKVPAQWLFESVGRYGSFSQVMCPTFLETLDGSWNGASGLGKEIYSAMEIKNRLKCHVVDNAMLRAGITLQARTDAANQKAQLVQIGAMNILPADYSIQQASILGDVDGQLKVDRALETMISSNTGVYRQRMDQPTGNPRTAEEVRLQYQNAAVLSNSAVNRFYCDLDRFYTEIYRRVTAAGLNPVSDGERAAIAFVARCMKRGVPLKVLARVKHVRAMRAVGNGSAFMRQQAISQTASFVSMFPEAGKQEWLTEALASYAGQEASERWNPSPAVAEKPTDHKAQAMIENSILKMGGQVLWTPTQNNVEHAQVHLQAGAQAAEAVTRGADAVEVADFLQNLGAHLAVHIQHLAGDTSRQEAYKALNEQFNQLAQVADRLLKTIPEKQEAQQEQAPPSPEEQKMEIERRKADQDMAIKRAKFEQETMITDLKTAREIAKAGREQ